MVRFRLVALAALCLAPLACVVWPEGSGPAAPPVPLAEALDLRDRGEAVLVDVRSREDYAEGHLPGAVNIPASQVEERAAEIRRMGRLPILYCACPEESSSVRAVRTLQAKGIDARVLADGIRGWQETGRPLEVTSSP
jgi:rhodanese-related sulfurtransferase